MKIMILNWESIYNKNDFIDVSNIWVSPDKQHLIVERYKSELFVSAKVITDTSDGYIAEFIECYEPHYSSIDFRGYRVDWSCMKYGFCKLLCFEMESGFDGTAHRFYFDRNLYRRQRAMHHSE